MFQYTNAGIFSFILLNVHFFPQIKRKKEKWNLQKYKHIHIHTHTRVCMYICMCVCVYKLMLRDIEGRKDRPFIQ